MRGAMRNMYASPALMRSHKSAFVETRTAVAANGNAKSVPNMKPLELKSLVGNQGNMTGNSAVPASVETANADAG